MKKLLLLVLIFLTGCHKISHGTVVHKEIHPAYQTFIFVPMSCGKNCTSIMPIPVYYPESYSVEVMGKYEGNDKQETFYLDRAQFDGMKTGDIFSCGEEKECITDRPHVEK
jgi:hypothetical protein